MNQHIVSKEQVLCRLRETFLHSVKERTGVSFFLSQEEQQLISKEDVEKLKAETGYAAMVGQQDAIDMPSSMAG